MSEFRHIYKAAVHETVINTIHIRTGISLKAIATTGLRVMARVGLQKFLFVSLLHFDGRTTALRQWLMFPTAVGVAAKPGLLRVNNRSTRSSASGLSPDSFLSQTER